MSQRQFQKFANPSKFEKRMSDQREWDRKRQPTEKRLAYNRMIDAQRRATEERLAYNRMIDEQRRETEERLAYNRIIDANRRETDARQIYMKDRKFINLLQSIETDTGFNVICVCCAEYKSRNQ